MIRHIVLWKLKEQAEGTPKAANAAIMKERLEALAGIVPELRTIAVSVNNLPACGNGGNYDVVLDATFDDVAGLDKYQTHPAHVEVVGFVRSVVEGRACIDFEN